MKIGIYSGVIPGTTFIEALVHGLDRAGHQVLVFGKKGGEVSYRSPGIRCFYRPVGKLRFFLNACYYWSLFLIDRTGQVRSIYRLVRSENHQIGYFFLRSSQILPVLWADPDVFHIQWVKLLPAWIFLRNFNIKVVLSLRGSQINCEPITNHALAGVYRKHFPLVDGFHAVSRAIFDKAAIYGARSSVSRVIYSYVPDDILKLGASRLEEYDKPTQGSRLSIISVGRGHWIKGYNYALDAMKILKDRGHDFDYTIVAGGENEEYEYQIFDQGLSDCVSICHELSHDEVIHAIQESDILLLSSVQEGVANVVLEAMGLGTLVISTICGGMSEVITHKENGFLVPVRNPQAIASMIIHVSQLGKDERKKVAKNALATIHERHNSARFSQEMTSLYNLVLSNGNK